MLRSYYFLFYILSLPSQPHPELPDHPGHLDAEGDGFAHGAGDGADADALLVINGDLHEGDLFGEHVHREFETEGIAGFDKTGADFFVSGSREQAHGAAAVGEDAGVVEELGHLRHEPVSPLQGEAHVRALPDHFARGAGAEDDFKIVGVGE